MSKEYKVQCSTVNTTYLPPMLSFGPAHRATTPQRRYLFIIPPTQQRVCVLESVPPDRRCIGYRQQELSEL